MSIIAAVTAQREQGHVVVVLAFRAIEIFVPQDPQPTKMTR